MNEQIESIARKKLIPCPFQPRKTFDEGKLDELAVSVRKQGIISPLIARKLADGTLQIVCGECRWRASGARTLGTTGEKLAELAELPVLFRTLTDLETMELMLVENMQRADLSPLEECDAFARALAEKKDGKAVHTQATLAAKIGISEQVVQSRLGLMKLSKEGRAALAAGKISYRVARRICEAPAALVPKIEAAILDEKKYPLDRWPLDPGDAMTVEDVSKLLEHISAWLSNAPFKLDDAMLVPRQSDPATGERIQGGACVGCEFNSATAENAGARKAMSRCMNAACYKHKVEVHVAAALVKAKEAGETVLKESEAKKILERGLFGANQSHVELDKKLGEDERARGITDKAAPTWQEVVTDKAGKVAVPVVVVVDEKGCVRRFAERQLVAAAADKLGTSKVMSLDAGRGKSLDATDRAAQEKKQRAKELAEGKERMQTAFELASMLVGAVEKKRVPEAASAALLPLAINLAGFDACKFICKRRELDGAQDAYLAVRKYGEKLSAGPQLALVFELFVARDLTHCAGPYASGAMSDCVKPVMKFYGVELAAAKAAAKEKLAAKEPKKKEVKAKPVKPVKQAAAAIAAVHPEVGPWLKWTDLLPNQKTVVIAAMKGVASAQLAGKEYRFAANPDGSPKLMDSRNVQPPSKPAKAKKTPAKKG